MKSTAKTAAPAGTRFRKIGLYDAYLSTLGGGENFLAVLAELLEEEFPEAEIDLLTHEEYRIPLEALTQRFGVNLRRARIRTLSVSRRSYLSRLHPLRRLLHEQDVAQTSESYDLFVNNTIFSLTPARAPLSIYMCMFPLDPRPAWLRRISTSRRIFAPYTELRRHLYHRWVKSYDRVLANSEFTRGWIRRYWNLDSEVLYPPIATRPDLALGRKQNAILGLGRFFPGDHNKKHGELIDMMRRLVSEGVKDWELHLVGGRTRVPGTDSYIEDLKRRAAGLPVSFHLDASKDRLQELFATCSLFWHATGYGEREMERPEKLEHFGMSTVEAMTHGCVPIVYACGGQPEIIEHGRSGFLWRSLDEFRQHSLRLIGTSSLRREMARQAHARSQRFSRAAFRSSVRELLRPDAER